MKGEEIRRRYLEFFRREKHAIIPSASLVPENDPTTLFTGSGMQPLIPYLMGEKHPKGTRLADSQKCFRAEDIEEVGDNRHTTFFEMLGNWSLGDYFKEEQLRWFFTFLVDEVGLTPEKLYVTVFAGDETLGIPRDDESVRIWKQLFKERGIDAQDVYIGTEEDGYRIGMQGGRIFYYDAAKNWWSRSGKPGKMPVGEIGGPDSEVFYDFGPAHATHPDYKDKEPHPNSDSGQFLEIGNSVFIEYIKDEDGSFKKLPQQNVDFGGGLERIAAAAMNNPDVFRIDLLETLINAIATYSGQTYENHLIPFRIIADHIRGATFMIGDGVQPSNTEQGYFVRRLLRRSVRYADQLGMPPDTLKDLGGYVVDIYTGHYPHLADRKDVILNTIAEEERQFRKTLERGMREFHKIEGDTISGSEAFVLFTTYGFPYELTEELAKEKKMTVDRVGYEAAMRTHQELSRAGAEQKFKGGLADHSEKVIRYHTATHLLLAGLRNELGVHVHQAGSNITGERLRFDFTHGEKLSSEHIQNIEKFVNDAIASGAIVTTEVMDKERAHADASIEGSFWERYPDHVKVYTITAPDGAVYSRELCGGPHVSSTHGMGRFSITKEEAVSAGVRRIKAVLA